MKFLYVKWRRASWLILIGFLSLAILDFYSTFINKLRHYMEINPLYLAGGWWPVIILNLISVYILLKAYGSKNIFNRFMSINTFIWLSVLRISVIINNFRLTEQVNAGEITVEMVQGVSDAVKATHHAQYIMLGILLPMIVTNIIYWVFLLDHKVIDRCGVKQ